MYGHTADNVGALAEFKTVEEVSNFPGHIRQTSTSTAFILHELGPSAVYELKEALLCISLIYLDILKFQLRNESDLRKKHHTTVQCRRASCSHLAGWNLCSSSVSVSL